MKKAKISAIKDPAFHYQNQSTQIALQNKLDKASKARLFGVLFDTPPTYTQLADGTATANINPLFAISGPTDELLSNKKAVQTIRSGGPDRI